MHSMRGKADGLTDKFEKYQSTFIRNSRDGVMGVSFQVQTHKTPLPLPLLSSGRKRLRTGTYETVVLKNLFCETAAKYAKMRCPSTLLRTVSLSNGRSTTSEQMVVKLKRDPLAPMCHRIRSELWKQFLGHDTSTSTSFPTIVRIWRTKRMPGTQSRSMSPIFCSTTTASETIRQSS